MTGAGELQVFYAQRRPTKDLFSCELRIARRALGQSWLRLLAKHCVSARPRHILEPVWFLPWGKLHVPRFTPRSISCLTVHADSIQ